eukprot:1922773-Amphidinium_carterae.1
MITQGWSGARDRCNRKLAMDASIGTVSSIGMRQPFGSMPTTPITHVQLQMDVITPTKTIYREPQ